jgi:flagellar hook assembly protein FlgD
LLDAQEIPTNYALEQNYPNPFNMQTEIVYQLPEAGYVTLSIYNSMGQRIRTLVSRNQEAGRYAARWNGRDEQGREVSSGIYIYRLETSGFNHVKKMLLIK